MAIKLKNKRSENDDYSQLKAKVFNRILLMAAGAVIMALMAYAMATAVGLGNILVSLLQRILNFSYDNALSLYQRVFRNNIEIIIIIVTLAAFFMMLHFLLNWFTKYFNEINRGINQLVCESGEAIILLPELAAIEKKLNAVRQALEKRKLEAKIAEQRKNELVMYLAHDIKTPLTSVIGYLSLLDEAQDMPALQKEKYIHITLDKAYRLEALINEFFEITRYNLQTMVLEKQSVDISYLLIQMADEFYPQLAPYGKTINLNIDEKISVYGDPNKLARVFNNILKNAIAYGDADSAVNITAAVKENNIVVTVENIGKTIPAEKLSRIFERFYRLDESRSTDAGGAGLGLAIAKEIVLLHHGDITAKSENGITTFTVSIPMTNSK
ncbi:MAG: HAMP domain-containing sensor histidine kinase [Clostridia bacterium]